MRKHIQKMSVTNAVVTNKYRYLVNTFLVILLIGISSVPLLWRRKLMAESKYLAFPLRNETRINDKKSLVINLNQSAAKPLEVAIAYFQEDEDKHYSKFRCTGHENDINSWGLRLCVFNHICYHTKRQRFEYFRRSSKPTKPIFFDTARGMLTDFGPTFLSLSLFGAVPWSPVIVNEAFPNKDMVVFKNLHTLWRYYFRDNVGHVIWEEFGMIYYSMERMNEVDNQSVIMHPGPIPLNEVFHKYQYDLVAAITPNKMVEMDPYVSSFNKTYVCFERLMAGGELRVFDPNMYERMHGREALMYSWRSKIIKHFGFDPNFTPKKHQILLTNKSHSIAARTPTSGHRNIANLKAVEEFIRTKYSTISLEVVEWHKVPFAKQIEMLLNTTILITPSGGVSGRAPFLPRGGHAIIMDYYATRAMLNQRPGNSATLEGEFHNYFPHYHKDYYQLYNTNEFVWDFPGATDTRNDASVIVNMTRLSLLIDKALEDMQP